MKKEHKLLRASLIVGIGLLPVLLRKPGIKKWSVIHVTNGITSQLTDSYLVRTKKLKYPVRLFPNKLRTQFVYDYLICPLITIIYCQASYSSTFPSTIAQGFIFGIPQIVIEYIAEKKTKLIKYGKGWTWIHSYLGIVAVKFAFRGLFELIKPKASSDTH